MRRKGRCPVSDEPIEEIHCRQCVWREKGWCKEEKIVKKGA